MKERWSALTEVAQVCGLVNSKGEVSQVLKKSAWQNNSSPGPKHQRYEEFSKLEISQCRCEHRINVFFLKGGSYAGKKKKLQSMNLHFIGVKTVQSPYG